MSNFFDEPIHIEDYITGNKFINICHEYNIKFAKTDYVFDGLNELVKSGDHHKPTAFVTHQSDYGITTEHAKHLPKNVIWFAENCEVLNDERFVGIPNGLNNMEYVINSTSKNGLYTSCFSHLADFHNNLYRQNDKQKVTKNLVYMNFTQDTSFSERTKVYRLFHDKKFVTTKFGIPHEVFAEDVYSHPFTLSPRGNGYDCVRTWESLYLRSIPIIKRNNVMSHFSDLPILFVDEWEQITEEFLLEKLEELKNKDFDLSKAKISYWKSRLSIYGR